MLRWRIKSFHVLFDAVPSSSVLRPHPRALHHPAFFPPWKSFKELLRDLNTDLCSEFSPGWNKNAMQEAAPVLARYTPAAGLAAKEERQPSSSVVMTMRNRSLGRAGGLHENRRR